MNVQKLTVLIPKLNETLKQPKSYRADILIGTVISLIAAVGSFVGGSLINSIVFINSFGDIWFDSDTEQYTGAMLYREANHTRSDKHPLFSLMTYPVVFVLKRLTGNSLLSIKLLVALFAFLFAAGLFAVLRLMGCRRIDAILFSAIGLASAATLFWATIPETFSLGAFTILLALGIAILAQEHKVYQRWFIGVSALTLSVTVTNWMLGILATLSTYSWKRSLKITVQAFAVTMGLWGIDKLIFLSARIPFWVAPAESQFLFHPQSGGPLCILKSFIFDTMVMPAVNLPNHPHQPGMLSLSIQTALPGSAGLAGAIAVGLWTALLALGIGGFFACQELRKFRFVLGLGIVSQLLLHLVYGHETFLYSMHFLVLLLPLAAFGTLTKQRPYVLGLGVLLLVFAGLNNISQFINVTQLIQNGALKIPGTF